MEATSVLLTSNNIFHYLTEEISEDLHVVPVDGSNIPDSLNPPSQQLSGIDGRFSTVRRHPQVTLSVRLRLRTVP